MKGSLWLPRRGKLAIPNAMGTGPVRAVSLRRAKNMPTLARTSAGLAAMVLTSSVLAQTLTPEFAGNYVIRDIGPPPGVPANFGGLTIREDQPNVLYIGGLANSLFAKIYSVPLTRDSTDRIIGYACGTGVEFCAANGMAGGIDGGLEFGPGNVLFYTTYADNLIGQVRPGETVPAAFINLGSFGVAASTGTLRFVPPGFAGAGRLKIVCFNHNLWYDSTVVALRNGTYTLATIGSPILITGGPEGVAYIKAGSPNFTEDSVLICEWGLGNVVAYVVDANGDPIPSTRRVIITGLSGAEGATFDPISGDFLFSTYGGGNRVIALSGFDSLACSADLDGSGVIDAADLAVLLGDWGDSGGGLSSDFNSDCTVNAADLAILLGTWGPCD
jgi:hypothetical protein